MKRGPAPRTIPNIRWRVDVRQDLAASVELLLLDPVSGTIAYGARNQLLNTLLAEWLEKQKAEVKS